MKDKAAMTDENKPAERADVESTTDKFDDFIRTLFFAALIALSIRAFAFEPFNIPSSSMVPNLLVGDYLFVSKYSYGYSSRSTLYGLLPMSGRLFFTEPERGDVAVFKLPSDNRTDYIKRIIGLPGDTVEVRNGLLYINGVPVDRRRLTDHVAQNYVKPSVNAVDFVETLPEGNQHVIREEGDDRPLDNTPVFQVPQGHYFTMGDNRDNSQDSRTPMVSFIPKDNLVGRAEIIFFSLDEKRFFWEFWHWPASVRWGRLFKKIV